MCYWCCRTHYIPSLEIHKVSILLSVVFFFKCIINALKHTNIDCFNNVAESWKLHLKLRIHTQIKKLMFALVMLFGKSLTFRHWLSQEWKTRTSCRTFVYTDNVKAVTKYFKMWWNNDNNKHSDTTANQPQQAGRRVATPKL